MELGNDGRPSGHDHIVSGGYGVGAVHHDVHVAPVGNHHAPEAEFIAQDFRAQIRASAGESAVDLVEGSHNISDRRMPQHNLKGLQIQLPGGALCRDGVRGVVGFADAPPAVGLLLIQCEMLGAAGNGGGFRGPLADVRAADAGHIGILREILEVPPSDGIPVEIQSWGQPAVYLLFLSFLSAGAAEGVAEIPVKTAGDGHAGRPGNLSAAGGTVLVEGGWDAVLRDCRGNVAGVSGRMGIYGNVSALRILNRAGILAAEEARHGKPGAVSHRQSHQLLIGKVAEEFFHGKRPGGHVL